MTVREMQKLTCTPPKPKQTKTQPTASSHNECSRSFLPKLLQMIQMCHTENY